MFAPAPQGRHGVALLEARSDAGPNGAGKTTVFNLITRLYQPGAGEIAFGGKSLLEVPLHRVPPALGLFVFHRGEVQAKRHGKLKRSG